MTLPEFLGDRRPHSPFNWFDRELEEMFDRFFVRDGSMISTPVVHYDDTGDAYALKIDLPGVKKEDLKIELKDNVLTLTAQRDKQKFQKFLELPSTVDVDRVEAGLENGVLSVRLPKTKAATPRMIEVKSN